MKVAILGASGIGKNHARWFHKHGCDVSAFLGSSAATTASTIDGLQAQFPFEGIGYTDLEVLLREEQPDAVCISTPSALHFAQALDCLEAGVHALCEKPLIYAPTRSHRENRDGARELVKIAKKKKLILGVQLQYASATPTLCRLLGVVPAEISDFAMELETTNANAPRDAHELWADLGPHGLSVAQILAGEGAKLDEESVHFSAQQTPDMTEVIVRWRLNCADGRLFTARFIGRYFDPAIHSREPRRRFAFNGRVIYYSGLQTRAGKYLAQYMTPDGYTTHFDDPVDGLIKNFVRACNGVEPILVSGEMGVQNLEWMLRISDFAPESVPLSPSTVTTPVQPAVPQVTPEYTIVSTSSSASSTASTETVTPSASSVIPDAVTPEVTVPVVAAAPVAAAAFSLDEPGSGLSASAETAASTEPENTVSPDEPTTAPPAPIATSSFSLSEPAAGASKGTPDAEPEFTLDDPEAAHVPVEEPASSLSQSSAAPLFEAESSFSFDDPTVPPTPVEDPMFPEDEITSGAAAGDDMFALNEPTESEPVTDLDAMFSLDAPVTAASKPKEDEFDTSFFLDSPANTASQAAPSSQSAEDEPFSFDNFDFSAPEPPAADSTKTGTETTPEDKETKKSDDSGLEPLDPSSMFRLS